MSFGHSLKTGGQQVKLRGEGFSSADGVDTGLGVGAIQPESEKYNYKVIENISHYDKI